MSAAAVAGGLAAGLAFNGDWVNRIDSHAKTRGQ
jgi:hypothetical protein